MDNFVVSARKYRPQHFNTVVGQSHITTTLKNAILSQHLAHAFLFCGPRGVGKTTCARILAKTINCTNISAAGEACDQCQSCQSFNEGASLNIHELDAASNNSVDDIRALVEQVRFAPQAGKYKVYIVDEVHMLSAAAFNAFLKTLEEPPPYAIFILATTEKHKILPTILSRCQIFDFKRITGNDTVEHLEEICGKEGIQAEASALQLIAQKSEGCMRDALSILDKIVSFTNGHLSYQNTLEHLNILDADYYFQMLDCMLKQDLAGALLLFDQINQKGFEGDLVLNGFTEFARNLLVCKDERVLPLLEVMDHFKSRYAEAAKKTPIAYLVSMLNLLTEAEVQYKSARNKKLQIELTLIKLCYLQQALDFTQADSAPAGTTKVQATKPLAFRQLPLTPMSNRKKKEGPVSESISPAPVAPPTPAKLVIESDLPIPAEMAAPSPPSPVPTPEVQPKTPVSGKLASTSIGKLSGLTNIRKEVALQQQQKVVKESVALSAEALQACWNEYIQYLRSIKNPAYASFELAQLEVLDAQSFQVFTGNALQLKYIEHERLALLDILQKKFHNRNIQVKLVMDPSRFPTVEVPVELSARDQFVLLTQKFPLVLELQQRLKLELD